MAFLEKRGNRFRVIFRHAGRRYAQALKTSDETIAQGFLGGIQKTLMLLDQKVLKVPEGVAVSDFVINNGQVDEPASNAAQETNRTPAKDITLGELKEQFIQAHSAGAMEKNSLETVAMHLRHLIKTFGVNFSVQTLDSGQPSGTRQSPGKEERHPQSTAQPGDHPQGSGQLPCAAWNWAVQMGLVTGN